MCTQMEICYGNQKLQQGNAESQFLNFGRVGAKLGDNKITVVPDYCGMQQDV